MDEVKTFPKLIARVHGLNKTVDFQSNLCLADLDHFAMIQNPGGKNSRKGGWRSGIQIAVTDKGGSNKAIYVKANLDPALFVTMEEVAKKNVGTPMLLSGGFLDSIEDLRSGMQSIMDSQTSFFTMAAKTAKSLAEGTMKASLKMLSATVIKGSGEILQRLTGASAETSSKDIPFTWDWSFSETKVNDYDQDQDGLARVTLVTINRSGINRGQPSRYPWYFKIESFRAKAVRSKNGTTQYDKSTIKDKESAFINISDKDALEVFHRVNRFIDLWEMTYGIPLIKEGFKKLENERSMR